MTIEAPDIHGAHVSSLQAGYEKLRWNDPCGRTPRARVRERTCECRARIFELCAAGGLMFIRRTDRDEKGPVHIAESEWWPTARAHCEWLRLLTGQTR